MTLQSSAFLRRHTTTTTTTGLAACIVSGVFATMNNSAPTDGSTMASSAKAEAGERAEGQAGRSFPWEGTARVSSSVKPRVLAASGPNSFGGGLRRDAAVLLEASKAYIVPRESADDVTVNNAPNGGSSEEARISNITSHFPHRVRIHGWRQKKRQACDAPRLRHFLFGCSNSPVTRCRHLLEALRDLGERRARRDNFMAATWTRISNPPKETFRRRDHAPILQAEQVYFVHAQVEQVDLYSSQSRT